MRAAGVCEQRGQLILGNDNLPAISGQAGRAMAEGGVARARESDEHLAEAGEMALNAFEVARPEFRGLALGHGVQPRDRTSAHR